MRVLIALTYYRPHYSGLTIYTERVARALAERGHQVTVLTSRFDENLAPREDCNGVQVIRPKVWFHVSKGVIMPSMWLQAWKLARQSDVIHLHVPQLDAAPIALMGKLLASFGELKSQPLKHSDPFPRVVGSVTSPSLLSALARTKKTPDKNLTAQDSLTLASAHQYFL